MATDRGVHPGIFVQETKEPGCDATTSIQMLLWNRTVWIVVSLSQKSNTKLRTAISKHVL